MISRKTVGVFAGIFTFIGVMVLFAIGIQTLWPNYEPSDHPFDRLIVLTVSTVLASFVYNLIKGEEPEEPKEVKTYSNKEISRRLAESRGEVSSVSVPDQEPVQEAGGLERENAETKTSGLFNERNFKYVENSGKKSVNEIEVPAALPGEKLPEKHVNEETRKPLDMEVPSKPVNSYSHVKSHSEPSNDHEPLHTSYNRLQTSSKPVYCPACHKANIEGALYCAECGTELVLYATLLNRFLAFLVDFIVLGVFSFGLLIITIMVIPNSDTTNSDLSTMVWLVLSLFASFIYFVLFQIEGQTIGKMAIGIEVVTDSPHEKIGLLKSFLRTILLVVDLMPYLLPGLGALIVMAISDKNQRIGDMAAKTVVIKK